VVWVGTAAILAIALAGWITFSKVEVLNEATGWVNHTERVRYNLQRALTTLQDAESSTRGFVITRDESFLETYSRARGQLQDDFDSLESQLAERGDQLERARTLRRLSFSRLEILQRTIDSIRAGTYQLPEGPAVTSEGNRRMEAVRAEVAMMQAEENRLLSLRLVAASDAHKTALAATVGTTTVAAALVLLLLMLDRRATQAIRHSEEWLATTLTSIGDGVIATDATGLVRFLNPVAAQLTGWSEVEARGKPLSEVFHIVSETDRSPAESPVVRVLREGVIVGLANHTLLVRRDGAEFPIEDSGAPIRNPEGGVDGVVMVFKDASTARAAQAALEASEERLRLALEGAELGALDHDLTSGQAIWNDRLYDITGYPRGTVVTSEMISLRTAPEDWEQVLQALQRASRERTPFHFDHRIIRANDGAVRWVSAHGTFIYDEEGKARRFIGVLQDVTQTRQLEQQVRQTQKLDALGTLAGGIAHDFNNILAVLRGNLSVIRGEIPGDHSIAPAVADMTRACDRAAALVRQILTFGSRQDHNRQVVQLEGIVAEAMQLLRATLPAEIDIQTRYAPDLPPVRVDPNQIQQIITNLGINSAQAIGRKPGVIEVHLDSLQVDAAVAASSPELHEGQYVRLRFSDSGTGMTRQIMDRIFEPFFTTKSGSAGTGLGLSVVRGILKNHDAAISVYSEPDSGTRFHIYFPVVLDRAPPVSPTTLAPRRGHGERILFLDDEPSLVVLATRLLERMGYRVASFTDSIQALAAFEAAPKEFDLVLTDLSMPGMNGLDFARRILAVRADIPVLLATGYVRPEDVELARSIGIREVIWKPQTLSEMGDLLAQQLDKLVPGR